MTNETTDYDLVIGGIYGNTHSPESFVKFHLEHYSNRPMKKTTNNLTMRQQITSYGFNRVSRKFADKVIELYST